MPSKVILIGVSGFGAWHLTNIRRLRDAGQAQLIACVDPVIKAKVTAGAEGIAPDDAPLFDSLSDAIADVGVPDIVVASVPIHLHAPIASAALRAGADVLLEKPPFSRMEDFEDLVRLEQETGRAVQIAFQSLGSLALQAFASDALEIGEIRAVRAMGTWLRRKPYWSRSPWVGRKSIGDIDVVDGVATNALAHAVITALSIAGIKLAQDVARVEVESYRASPVDVDDTTSIRVTPVKGPVVTANLTLCASVQTLPTVEVVGERGVASFSYVGDNVEVKVDGESRSQHFGRVDLLENLIAHRKSGAALLSPLRSTGAFMRVLETIRTGPQPVHIERRWIDVRDEGDEAHPVVQDVEKWIRAAADADGLFSEVGAPWAFTGKDAQIARADLDGRVLFEVVDGAGTNPTSSPRPYIHPVRTLSGVEVTATRPADHDWHLGLGFAVPDVDGISFWGGGTFILNRGYVMLDNHGTMTTEKIDQSQPAGLDHTLAWRNPDGREVIRELRGLRWTRFTSPAAGTHGGVTGWALSFRTTLTAVDGPVSLGSPGTNGRVNAGYGGFFWRLPRCSDVVIMSAEADGEDEVHGSVSPWIAWSARFEARPGVNGEATLVLIPEDTVSAADPWVVRQSSYPGIGSAVAWEKCVEIPAGQSISRGFKIAVLDGRLDRAGAQEAAETLQLHRQ
ncbi:hypothetical protein EHS25_000016 [Saitozyma podzolica]|uniref:Gfo/Idh/MocA-like oxidoreductase N-terminal domain-containing protein n=1 Tax=Saitozyma podzolica TaxID=1890683 RepID=A0A427YV20_9TREE|nr:hypothetical protein EHS25_000016 [Saitozyma podzolica]